METLQGASYEKWQAWKLYRVQVTKTCEFGGNTGLHGGAAVETWSVSLLSLPALRGWGGRRRLALAPPFCLKNNRNCKSVQHYAKSVFNASLKCYNTFENTQQKDENAEVGSPDQE